MHQQVGVAIYLRKLHLTAVDEFILTWKIMNKSSESRNGQRIYVGIIATGTLLLLGLFLWPLTVGQFRTTAVFKLKYQPDSGVEKTTLNSWIVEALRVQTDRSAIADILSQMDSVLTSSVLNSLDPETIREAIQIQGRPGAIANSVEYRLSMMGEGTDDEVEFINLVIARINNQLDFQLTRNNSANVVQALTDDFAEFHENRMLQLSGQLSEVVDQLSTAQNDIRIASSDLQTLLGGVRQKVNFTRPTAQELQSLEQEKASLLAKPEYNEFHPEVAAIRMKIEALSPSNTEVTKDFSKAPTGNAVFSEPEGDTKFVPNKFFSTRSKTKLEPSQEGGNTAFAASVSQIIDAIEMIDLTTSRRTLAGVQDSIEQENAIDVMVKRLNERAVSELEYQSPVSLADLELAKRSSPVGGAPTTTQFLCLFLLAGGFGSIVASNYDPSIRKRPFRSVDQLQRTLNVPVVGVLRNASTVTHRPFNKLFASRAIQFCEWTLLALAILLIIAALANSELAIAFIENPFHGITETIWLITPTK